MSERDLCDWCGGRLPDRESGGRRRRYCGRSCRQRAYERRSVVSRGGLPRDMVILSVEEFADLSDRVFQLRCAAEDVATAVTDGAAAPDLADLARSLIVAARGLEKVR